MKIFIHFLVASVLLSQNFATAGGLRRSRNNCAPRHCNNVVVQKKVIVQQQAAIVAVPQVIVPAVVAVQGATLYGYGHQGYAHAYQANPAVLARESALLAKQAQGLASETLKVYQTSTDAVARSQKIALIEQMIRLLEDDQQSETRIEYEKKSAVGGSDDGAAKIPPSPRGVSVLQSRCASCHDADPKGGFDINNIDGLSAGKAIGLVISEQMPPLTNAAGESIPRLTSDEVLKLEKELFGDK